MTERGAPVPLVLATVGPRGSTDRVFLAGLSGRTAVNKPVLTAGSPLREDGIVLERSLANALGIEVGATLAVTSGRGTIDLPVLGTAVVPSQPRYPRSNPGLAWVTPATLERVEPDRTRWRWTAGASTGESVRGCGVHRASGSRLPAHAARLSRSRPGKPSAITRSAMHRARR